MNFKCDKSDEVAAEGEGAQPPPAAAPLVNLANTLHLKFLAHILKFEINDSANFGTRCIVFHIEYNTKSLLGRNFVIFVVAFCLLLGSPGRIFGCICGCPIWKGRFALGCIFNCILLLFE